MTPNANSMAAGYASAVGAAGLDHKAQSYDLAHYTTTTSFLHTQCTSTHALLPQTTL